MKWACSVQAKPSEKMAIPPIVNSITCSTVIEGCYRANDHYVRRAGTRPVQLHQLRAVGRGAYQSIALLLVIKMMCYIWSWWNKSRMTELGEQDLLIRDLVNYWLAQLWVHLICALISSKIVEIEKAQGCQIFATTRRKIRIYHERRMKKKICSF